MVAYRICFANSSQITIHILFFVLESLVLICLSFGSFFLSQLGNFVHARLWKEMGEEEFPEQMHLEMRFETIDKSTKLFVPAKLSTFTSPANSASSATVHYRQKLQRIKAFFRLWKGRCDDWTIVRERSWLDIFSPDRVQFISFRSRWRKETQLHVGQSRKVRRLFSRNLARFHASHDSESKSRKSNDSCNAQCENLHVNYSGEHAMSKPLRLLLVRVPRPF